MQVVQRWILARLSSRVFHSLGALNQAIDELLDALSARVTNHLKRSRAQLFTELDAPVLKPLPTSRYEVAYWKEEVKPNIDYHVDVFGPLYSVSYALRGEVLTAQAPATTVELFQLDRDVAHAQLAPRAR
jgi:hypothetical protein